jgi:hypothetical protein
MHDDPSVSLPVTRAHAGGQRAWKAPAELCAPVAWSICRRREQGDADATDAGQNVWLHLAGQLGNIRDPAALLPQEISSIASQQLCDGRYQRPTPAMPSTKAGHRSMHGRATAADDPAALCPAANRTWHG